MKLIEKLAQFVSAAALTVLLTACASTADSRSTGQIIDDTAIVAKVKAAMLNDPVIKGMEVDVDVHRGVVHLNGVVNGPAEKRKATEVARGVAGVKSVQNNLRIRQ